MGQMAMPAIIGESVVFTGSGNRTKDNRKGAATEISGGNSQRT